ncbi:MAG: HAMP domain-containing protein [Elusimicrobia bacterium]|nr:HAMP domain-containing protein [Elusimicrobiota bacterium]
MKYLRSGLFRKFLLAMGLLALVPAIYLAYRLSGVGQRGIQSAVLELQTKLAEKLAAQVESYFRVNEDKLHFAFVSLQKNMDWAEKQELLRALIDTHADIVEIAVMNVAGKEVMKVYNPELASDSALSSRADDAVFKRFLNARRRTMAISGPAETLELYYPLGTATGEGGQDAVRLTVVIRVLVSLAGLARSISTERVGGTGFAILVDEMGRPLFYPKEKLKESLVAEVPRWPIVSEALKAHSIGSMEFKSQGRTMVGAYAPLSLIGGAVVIVQPHGEAYWAAVRMRRMAWVTLAIVAVILVGASTLLARNLTSPLLSLSRAADAVSHGDFTASVKVETGDELQDLADTFNRMTDKLRQYADLQVDKVVAEQRKTDAILFSSSDGVLMTDTGGKIRLANRRALEFFGLESGTSVDGKDIPETVAEPKLRDAIAAALAEPKPDVAKDVNLSTEKAHKYLQVASKPLVSPKDGKTLGVLTSIRDVTLEKEIEKMKEEFLHYITHDLRNPLGSAMGFIEVLLKGVVGVLSPEQHNMVSSIQRSMSRLMSMINNILDIAKMESGRIRLQLQSASLSGVVCRSMAILESLAKQKKIQVSLDAAEEHTLDIDPDLVERVFTNLLGNAIKYTPAGGSITISLADEGKHIRCCVADTGDGIPESYREKVFEKFEQVTGQRKGGTGLGLTITKFFVESHRGRIWVESEVGKGSRFIFTLPRHLVSDAKGNISVSEEPRTDPPVSAGAS